MVAQLKLVNIKGHTKTIDLQKVNVLTGPNGSGKSAILEAIIVALDGEHPTAGKTLSAISSMISGDVGSIQLGLIKDNGDAIVITREISRTGQKILIDGRETLHAVAKEKIDQFMGASIRKIAPYKFMEMAPKERLASLAEVYPQNTSGDIRSMLKLSLCSGSPEFVGQSRYVWGKTPEGLTEEEMAKVLEKAQLVDGEYLALAARYWDAQGKDGLPWVDDVLEKNRMDVNECQSEITRLTKSIQTYQESLGTEIWESSDSENKIQEISGKILDLEKRLARIKYSKELHKTINAQLEQLSRENPDINAEIARLRKELKKYEKYEAIPGTVAETDAVIQRCRERLDEHKKTLPMLKTLEAGTKEARAEMDVTNKKLQTIFDKDLIKYAAERAMLEGNIATDKELHGLVSGGQCPVCDARIDHKKIGKKITDRIAVNQQKLLLVKGSIKALDTQKKELLKQLAEQEAVYLKQNNLLSVAQSKVLGDDEVKKLQDEIKAKESALGDIQNKEAFVRCGRELTHLTQRAEQIDNLKAQLLGLELPQQDNIQEEIDTLEAERAAYQEKANKQNEKKAIKNLLASEQITLAKAQEKRAELKKIRAIIEETKSAVYGFVADIINTIKSTMGYEGVVNAQLFAIDKNGIVISDKVLSGGERVMFCASILLAAVAAAASNTVKMVEIEGGELDKENVQKIAKLAQRSNIDLSIITTHIPIDNDLQMINVVRL